MVYRNTIPCNTYVEHSLKSNLFLCDTFIEILTRNDAINTRTPSHLYFCLALVIIGVDMHHKVVFMSSLSFALAAIKHTNFIILYFICKGRWNALGMYRTEIKMWVFSSALFMYECFHSVSVWLDWFSMFLLFWLGLPLIAAVNSQRKQAWNRSSQ